MPQHLERDDKRLESRTEISWTANALAVEWDQSPVCERGHIPRAALAKEEPCDSDCTRR